MDKFAAKKWLITGLIAVGLGNLPALAQDGDYQDNDPPARVARIGSAEGTVSLMTAGSQQWSDAPANYPMISGDRLYTDQGARVEVQSGSTQVRMWGGTDMTLTNLTDQYEQIGLAQGSIRVRVYGLNRDSTVEVDTPNGAVIINRPGDYRVDAYQNDEGADVVVNSGEAQITGPGVNQELEAGQAVRLNGSDQIEMTPVEVPGFDDLDNWSIQRDHHILNSRSAQYVNRDMVGYDDLDDNGSWSQESDYGPVWYPRNVDPDWRPYTYGHWAYVEPWGYTWVDDASWGYAPFHYGRWVEVHDRWGWVPGPREQVPVYSPALVAFVGGSHFSIGVSIGGGGGVAAWFPLGVGEPYVPWYHCSPRYVRQVNVTNVNIVNIHNTTVVNNYNTFITNTRTVNNVNNIRVDNIQYQNRNRVVAVSETDMSAGRRVNQAQVRLNPQQQQMLARAPVHVQPSAPVPAHPILAPARQNVQASVQRPALMTPRGVSRAVPATSPAQVRPPVNLPRPAPATALAKPAPGATIHPGVAGGVRPNGGPVAVPTNRPNQPVGNYNRPGTPVNSGQQPNGQRPVDQRPAPNQPATNQPPTQQLPYTPQPTAQQPQRPAPNQPPAYRPPQQPERPNTPPPTAQQPQRPVPNQPPAYRPPQQPERPYTPPPTAQQPQRPAPSQPPAYRPPQQPERPYAPPPTAQQPQRPTPNQPPAYRPPQQPERPYTPPPQAQRPVPPPQQRPYTPPPQVQHPPAQQERPYTPPPQTQRPAPQQERPAPPPPQRTAPPQQQREAPPAKRPPEKDKKNEDQPR